MDRLVEETEVFQPGERGSRCAVLGSPSRRTSGRICWLADSMIGESAIHVPPCCWLRPSWRLLISKRRPSSTIIGEKISDGTSPFLSRSCSSTNG